MDREKQIDEMALIALKNTLSYTCAKQIAINFYNAGYRKTFTSDFASDTQKAYEEGYEKGIETKAEMERLKAQLSEFAKPVPQFIKDSETQAVKEFAAELKMKAIKLTAIESYHICEFVDELLKEYEK